VGPSTRKTILAKSSREAGRREFWVAKGKRIVKRRAPPEEIFPAEETSIQGRDTVESARWKRKEE